MMPVRLCEVSWPSWFKSHTINKSCSDANLVDDRHKSYKFNKKTHSADIFQLVPGHRPVPKNLLQHQNCQFRPKCCSKEQKQCENLHWKYQDQSMQVAIVWCRHHFTLMPASKSMWQPQCEQKLRHASRNFDAGIKKLTQRHQCENPYSFPPRDLAVTNVFSVTKGFWRVGSCGRDRIFPRVQSSFRPSAEYSVPREAASDAMHEVEATSHLKLLSRPVSDANCRNSVCRTRVYQ